MAAKKTSRTRSTASSEPPLQEQAEQLQRKLGESAQQIWLAGVGAFGRAQTEGSRLFETLVKEGSRVEQRAGSGAGKVREALDSGVHGARTRAAETLGRVDQAFRGKVQGALKSLEVPTRRELGALLDRIDSLNALLRRYNGQADTPGAKAHKSTARKTATRKTAAAGGPPARKAAVKKTTHKPRPRTAVTKVAGPAAGEAPAKKAAARKALR